MRWDNVLRLTLRTQELVQDDAGYNVWRVVETPATWPAQDCALLLCDVWDSHWSRGAVSRLALMLPRMRQVVSRARSKGVQIIHAPSDVIDAYEGCPARQRILESPPVEPPTPREHSDPPLPIDAGDHGSDTGETEPARVWTAQHPDIPIDQDADVISADGHEIYSFLRAKGIDKLLIMGVHANMCVLNRSFAVKAMVRWGIATVLVRDLTDTMYNPSRPPYVSHEEGTRLVCEYIEKFWCPTIYSFDMLIDP